MHGSKKFSTTTTVDQLKFVLGAEAFVSEMSRYSTWVSLNQGSGLMNKVLNPNRAEEEVTFYGRMTPAAGLLILDPAIVVQVKAEQEVFLTTDFLR